GYSAQINAVLGVSAVQETVTVSAQSPIVDTRDTGTKQTFTNELLQNIPSARDPWVILQQTAGIAMDRQNVGGNMSGQQSNYVSRGGMPFNNKWSLDGVDITDMAATGASPIYYDFDAFDEITINTGGVDVTQQTGGVGINLVTKSGGDRFRGSSRFYDTNDRLGSQNITNAQRAQGATSGNPIQDIQDYGIEAAWSIAQRPGVDLAQLRQAEGWCRRHQLLSSDAGLSADHRQPRRVPDRRGQRLPQHRSHHAPEHQPERRGADLQGQQGDVLQRLFEEGAQRAKREQSHAARIHSTADRGARLLWRLGLDDGAWSHLQARGPVDRDRQDPVRRAIRTRREQLHPRLSRGCPERRAADLHRLDRSERPLDARRRAVGQRQAGQPSERARQRVLSRGAARRPLVQDRRLLERRLHLQFDAHARLRRGQIPDIDQRRLLAGGNRLPDQRDPRRRR